MKRRRPLPLFEKTEPKVYLFDTSAWLDIESLPKCDEIWAAIRSLVNDGRVSTCAQVLGELRDDSIYLLRIKPMEKALLNGDASGGDIEFLQRVGRITHDFPSMSKATGTKTPADPYVVALAQMNKYTVVADESKRRKNRKIPGVCEQLGICCVTLKGFILAEIKGVGDKSGRAK